MPISDDANPSRGKWLWIAILAVLLLLVIGWFAYPVRKTETATERSPAPQSSEWAVEPSGSAVPVTLPETTMTNVPDQPERKK